MSRYSKVKISRATIKDDDSFDINEIVKKNNEKHFMLRLSNPIINANVCICMVFEHDITHNVLKNLNEFRGLFAGSHVVFCVSDYVKTPIMDDLNFTSVFKLKTRETALKRNTYLQLFRNNISSFGYMIVADPVAFETPFNQTSLSCFNKASDWDVLFANQSYKYYDINNLFNYDTMNYHQERDIAVKRVMLKRLQYHIPRDSPPIEVSSAFGGFAIYKASSIVPDAVYKNDDHRSFNIIINRSTKRMYIDPRMVIETHPDLSVFYV